MPTPCARPWRVSPVCNTTPPRQPCSRAKTVPLLSRNGHQRTSHDATGRQQQADQGADTPSDRDGPLPEPASGTVRVGGLTLQPASDRETRSDKIIVTVSVLRGGKLLDQIPLNNSASGRRDATRLLAALLDGEQLAATEISAAFSRIIAEASRRLAAAKQKDSGEGTIADAVAEVIPGYYQFTHRVGKGGAWSESLREDVSLNRYISHVPSRLMRVAARAIDAPKFPDGGVCRPALLRAIQAELTVSWADIYRDLPTIETAEVGADTTAAAAFKAQIIRVFTAPALCRLAKDDDNSAADKDGSPIKASLVSRIRHQARAYLDEAHATRKTVESRARWHSVREAYPCWWRPYGSRDGEVRIAIGIRWHRGDTLKLPLHSVTDQVSLTTVGARFGLLDPSPPVPVQLSGGKTCLAVLSAELTAELLEKPLDDDPESAG